MKKIFFISVLCFLLLELVINYLLMPYPGSQSFSCLTFLFYLFSIKIYLEIVLVILILWSLITLLKKEKSVLPSILILVCCFVYYWTNFKNTAEYRFKEPTTLMFHSADKIKQSDKLIVIGVEVDGESKAYPQPYIMYHHKIIDTIGSKIIMATYCGICQTGRIYEPYIDNQFTRFRLVGIQHGNAVFEDVPTKSWWSQETGICIAGKLKGKVLKELKSQTMTLSKWTELHPNTKVMLAEPILSIRYSNFEVYEENSKSNPKIFNTSTDWKPRTFIVGIAIDQFSKAYEWVELKKNRLILDQIDTTKIILMLSTDMKSFVAFENSRFNQIKLNEDTLFIDNTPYNMNGINLRNNKNELISLKAYREFWFSWKYANPLTLQYSP